MAAGAGTDTIVTARLSPRSTARTGEPLRVALDAERLHFFDPETGESPRLEPLRRRLGDCRISGYRRTVNASGALRRPRLSRTRSLAE